MVLTFQEQFFMLKLVMLLTQINGKIEIAFGIKCMLNYANYELVRSLYSNTFFIKASSIYK